MHESEWYRGFSDSGSIYVFRLRTTDRPPGQYGYLMQHFNKLIPPVLVIHEDITDSCRTHVLQIGNGIMFL